VSNSEPANIMGSTLGLEKIGDLREQVLDTLGREICDTTIAPGAVFTTKSLESRFQVSRPVVREALRALEALGMISPKRRVGMTVSPFSSWNVFDSRVIRWRLAGSNRVSQLRSLMEIRQAIEPAAARMAAVRAPLLQSSELVGLAGNLWRAGREGNAEEFLRLDTKFHTLVLVMSGNEMFAKLHHLIDEVLTGRFQYNLMPQYPAPEALQLHVEIAVAIQAGNADKARDSMVAIMEHTMLEMSSIWEQNPTA